MALDMADEDADDGSAPGVHRLLGNASGAGALAAAGDGGRADGLKPAGAGAAAYDFFATGGSGAELGGLEEEELGGLEGGLEDGVDVPPEEEEVEGGFTEEDALAGLIDDNGSQAEPTPVAVAPAPAAAQAPYQPTPPQGAPRRWSIDSASSFLADPVAGPPPRAAGTPRAASPWHAAGAGAGQDAPAARVGGLGQGFGPFAARGGQEPQRPLELWGGPSGLRSGLLGGHQQPRAQEWQPPPPPPPPAQPGQGQAQFLQRLAQGRPGQPPAGPPRATTVEELEARMVAAARARQQPPPPPADAPFPSLARHSAGSYARSPGHSRTPSWSLPGGVAGLQQGLGAVSLAQAAAAALGPQALPPSPGGLPFAQPGLARHSPSFAGQSPGGYLGQPYGPAGRLRGAADAALLQLQQQQQLGGRPGFGAAFAAAPPPPAQAHGRPGDAPDLRRRGSRYMEAEEIESILRIQWKSLHNGVPYTDDYYYQALVHKHTRGGNRRLFAPETLRNLAPGERLGAEPDMYVRLEGLGKIAYSNVRRPRPLMDLVAGGPPPPDDPPPSPGPAGQEDARRGAKPLEEEPLLAARIVIEDCACLLLDVDDIDRMWASANAAREEEHGLRQRRALLMDAFASSLRLPDGALPPPPGGPPGRASDAVFAHLMRVHKGRSLLARGLRLLHGELASAAGYAGPAGRRPPPLRILWAALRNVRLLFGVPGPHSLPAEREAEREAARRTLDATVRLAAAAAQVMRSLETPRAVCDCMAALVQGDLGAKDGAPGAHAEDLLPLLPTGEPVEGGAVWLADAVAALLTRAAELRLSGWAAQRGRPPEGLAAPEGAAWRDCFAAFHDLLHRHLATLAEVCAVASQAGADDAARYAKQIVPVGLIKACLPHMTEARREQTRAVLAQLT